MPRSILAVVVLAAALCGCGGDPKPDITSLAGFNLLVINIDALRADHLGCYGYGRPTSPFLDSLAKEGILFENASSNSSFTRESVAALMSGRLPSRSGSVGWYAHPAAGAQNLARRFRDAGYRTGLFTLTTMLDHPEFASGFDDVEHLTDQWGLSRAGPRLSARTIDFVGTAGGKKFMAYLHYLDPHGPYDPPDDLYRSLTTSPQPSGPDLYSFVRPNLPRLVASGFGPGERSFEDMVTRYDAEILDTDRALKALFDGLRALGVLDRTLVLISADHGEEFLEHGFVEHAWTLYRESLHVPLILWAPARIRPQRISTPVSVVDYLPTLLDLMEIPGDRSAFDGRALFERQGEAFRAAALAPRVLISELLLTERSVLRSLTKDGFRYIAAQKWIEPSERPFAVETEEQLHDERMELEMDLWGPVVLEELYELTDDPRETRNLAASDASRLAAFRQALDEYRRSCPSSVRRIPEDATPEEIEKLRSLGYVR